MSKKKTTKPRDYTYLREVLQEIEDQPAWREQANREWDYKDGNQLDSDVLQRLETLGIPPSIENVIGPTHDDITGMEAKTRRDFRVQPDGDNDPESDMVAKATSYKLNQAERRSGCDRACSDAYESQTGVGVGWVEVSRETNPFLFPYRCKTVHRNEIFWDFLSREPDLSDAKWILRRRWTDIDSAALMFPKHKDLIERSGTGWNNWDELNFTSASTSETASALSQSYEIERGFDIEEQEWRNTSSRRVCLFELLTREYEQALILKLPDGRVVELDTEDPKHIMAIALGTTVDKANITRIYKHFFLGPHLLHHEVSEFKKFHYIPFWGKREDRTRSPYGIIRWLMYLQDEINARISKMQWLLSATRTIRTDGASKLSDELLREEVGRPDADIILDQAHMGLVGAKFEVDQNFELNRQQYERLMDLRESVNRISSISKSTMGEANPDNAGAMSQAIEQTIQSLAKMNDNFSFSRMEVGDLLMSMIINDLGDTMEEVIIKGDALKDDVQIVLNQPTEHPETGERILTNDTSRTKLKVNLEDVPSTPTFRQQQLSAMTEFGKSLPPQYQSILMPYLTDLANIPNKDDIIKAIKEASASENTSPEQIAQQVAAAVEDAKVKWMVDQKNRELDIKEKEFDNKARETDARIKKIINETVSKAIESIYSATQAAVQINSMPGIAGSADQVLRSAGFEDQDQAPIVADGPITAPVPVQQNTSPMFPPRVQEPDIQPISEQQTEAPALVGPGVGMDEGIEALGAQ